MDRHTDEELKALTLAVVGLALVLLSGSTWAHAASSGNLVVSGSVISVNSIAIAPNGTNNTSLDILAGESGRNIASISEQSNNLGGYQISVYSSYGGELRNTADASKKTTYQLSYGGGAYFLVPSSNSPAVAKTVSSLSAMTTNVSAVLINVAAYPGAPAGSYTDTVTFSISAP